MSVSIQVTFRVCEDKPQLQWSLIPAKVVGLEQKFKSQPCLFNFLAGFQFCMRPHSALVVISISDAFLAISQEKLSKTLAFKGSCI